MMYYHPSTEALIDRAAADLAQGLLLDGPEGIGLATLAHTLARAYTKEVVTVVPDAKGTITIEQVRGLYAVGRSKDSRTVFVIDDADAMGIPAQNALLKLLEEPVAGIRFILTSHAADRLLPTIRSRVQTTTVKPISPQQSAALLRDLGVTNTTTSAQLLFIGEGLPALLTRYVRDEAAFAERSRSVRDARAFLGGTKEARLLISAVYKERIAARVLVRDMQKLVRRNAGVKPVSTAVLDTLLEIEAAIVENASVRLSLTRAALTL